MSYQVSKYHSKTYTVTNKHISIKIHSDKLKNKRKFYFVSNSEIAMSDNWSKRPIQYEANSVWNHKIMLEENNTKIYIDKKYNESYLIV